MKLLLKHNPFIRNNNGAVALHFDDLRQPLSNASFYCYQVMIPRVKSIVHA